MVKVSTPSRRVVTLWAMAADGGPVEHSLNTLAHAIRGFSLCSPDRLNDLQHSGSVNRAQGQVAQNRKGVLAKRGEELWAAGSPFLPMQGGISLDSLTERERG